MVDNIKKVGGLQGIDGTVGTSTKAEKKPGEIGKDEFLQLLVNQLKNQDPLEPMKNEEFAVNLAQFSQLEQLVGINNKLGGDTSAAGLAGYLGTEVTLNTDKVNVQNGDAGQLKVILPSDASSVNVELLDGAGKVVGEKSFNSVPKGEIRLDLSGMATGDGEYSYRIKGIGTAGGELALKGEVIGVVSGFIPGADPKLLVNGREVSPSDVRRAEIPPQLVPSDSSGSEQQ